MAALPFIAVSPKIFITNLFFLFCWINECCYLSSRGYLHKMKDFSLFSGQLLYNEVVLLFFLILSYTESIFLSFRQLPFCKSYKTEFFTFIKGFCTYFIFNFLNTYFNLFILFFC